MGGMTDAPFHLMMTLKKKGVKGVRFRCTRCRRRVTGLDAYKAHLEKCAERKK